MIEIIRKQIYKDTGVLVVPSNTTAKMPPLPFATINTASSYIKDVGREDISIVEDAEGLKKQHSEAYKFVFSVNVYAKTDEVAMSLTKTVRSWFYLTGESYLDEMNIVVTDLMNIENRTVFLVDSYEYRHGFDVQLRGSDVVKIGRRSDYVPPTPPPGSVENPDGTVTLPDGTVTHPDGSTTLPDGTNVPPVHYDWIETVELEFEGVKAE